MRTSRLALLTIVVVALVGLTSWWAGHPAERGDLSVDDAVPTVGTPETLSSTWYCAAGSAGLDPAPAHAVYLSNPSDEAVTARLTAYGAQGLVGASVVEAGARAATPVNVNALFNATDLSIMVESESGTLAVEHGLAGPTVADSVACSTTSSGAWFFPAQTSLTGSRPLLVLFNPFSADAGVDITAAIADGVRSPSEWAGIVVPAGSSRVVDLSQFVQLRDPFSLSVRMRTGRVVAETSQVIDINADEAAGVAQQRGLRLQVGVPEARPSWTFAAGFTGPGVLERLVVYNPNREPASVVVQVTPYGGAAMPPEPFELEVPGSRFASIDLNAETRIPPEGFHSIQVEADDGTPIVVGRVLQLSGPPTAPADPALGVRPNETLGSAIGTGSPTAAPRWLLPAVITGPDQQPMAFVHNPGTGIQTVTVRALQGDAPPIDVVVDKEIAPGDSGWIALTPAELPALQGATTLTYEVVASAPVVVERTITFVAENDLSVGLAVPFTR